MPTHTHYEACTEQTTHGSTRPHLQYVLLYMDGKGGTAVPVSLSSLKLPPDVAVVHLPSLTH